MKIRLYDYSVRIRITPSELSILMNSDSLQSIFYWGPAEHPMSFSFVVRPGKQPDLTLESGTNWVITLPSDKINRWGNSDEIGISEHFQFSEGHSMKVLIEKDFECKGREDEDKKDRFPHPKPNQC